MTPIKTEHVDPVVDGELYDIEEDINERVTIEEPNLDDYVPF